MKRVILLSVGFPFGNHEPFLRGELKYHKQLTLASAFMGDERRVKNNMPDDVNITLWHYPSPFFRGNKAARVLSAVGAFLHRIFGENYTLRILLRFSLIRF